MRELYGWALWPADCFSVAGTNVFAVPTSYPDILSIAEDREGNLWAGTGGGGLNRLRARIMELQNTENGLPFSSVRSVCEDAAGNLWAAAQNGELARRENGAWRDLSSESDWTGMRAHLRDRRRPGWRLGRHRAWRIAPFGWTAM